MDKLNLTSDTRKVKDFKERNLLIFQKNPYLCIRIYYKST